MTEKIEVPDEVLGAFNRIMNKVPREVRKDEEVQRSVLTFIKIGGLRLANHYVEYKKMPFAAEFDLVKKRQAGGSAHNFDLPEADTEDDTEDDGTEVETKAEKTQPSSADDESESEDDESESEDDEFESVDDESEDDL